MELYTCIYSIPICSAASRKEFLEATHQFRGSTDFHRGKCWENSHGFPGSTFTTPYLGVKDCGMLAS